MKLTHLILLSFLFLARGFGEEIPLLTSLDSKVNESSGLLLLDDQLITHNDSDEANELYEIDANNGNVLRTVVVTNVENNDWEDLAEDEEFLYIGDFGNNLGSRKDLKVYKIAKEVYKNSENDSIQAEIINFSYANQEEYLPARFNSNFDAEALISYQDKLYIFTKNWENKKTDVYELSKTPGTYKLEKIDTIETEGLITGATYDELNDRILLCGNSMPTPFIIELKEFSRGKFSNGEMKKYNLQPQLGASIQIEGITMINKNECYLSAEKSITGTSALYKYTFDKNLDQ
ncbi:hypothetical protein [Mesonia mobilis]|uniref:hypothetical protein n=1 Tax=Mesonia mobilis TaxID=369791 RepID=UPI0026ED3AC8|nr:hypothetical protein [Mesonia mobilis]